VFGTDSLEKKASKLGGSMKMELWVAANGRSAGKIDWLSEKRAEQETESFHLWETGPGEGRLGEFRIYVVCPGQSNLGCIAAIIEEGERSSRLGDRPAEQKNHNAIAKEGGLNGVS